MHGIAHYSLGWPSRHRTRQAVTLENSLSMSFRIYTFLRHFFDFLIWYTRISQKSLPSFFCMEYGKSSFSLAAGTSIKLRWKNGARAGIYTLEKRKRGSHSSHATYKISVMSKKLRTRSGEIRTGSISSYAMRVWSALFFDKSSFLGKKDREWSSCLIVYYP